MARNTSSTDSGSNTAQARGSTSTGTTRRISLTRVRRDASVELDDETSVSEYSEESGSDSEDEAGQPSPSNQKRARGSTVSSDQPTKQAKYTTLKSETRQVEADVIKNKWRPTTAAAQAKVKTVLSLVERPVINSNREPERRREAQSNIASLNRVIETRLPRMPFPPETKEWHFDYEAILRNNRDLEHQLAAAKHSSALTLAEIEKEEKALEEAQHELKELERNANAEQKARVQRERGMQQLWTDTGYSRDDDATRIGLQTSVTRGTRTLVNVDKNFPFINELESYLSNIEENVGQLANLPERIDHTSSVLTRLTDTSTT